MRPEWGKGHAGEELNDRVASGNWQSAIADCQLPLAGRLSREFEEGLVYTGIQSNAGRSGSPLEQERDNLVTQLHAGLFGEATAIVDERSLATTMGSGDVPVYATPSMIALMEQAALRAVAECLESGKTTVGVHVDVRHLAASPLGREVRAQARLTLIEGRRLTFRVLASDGETEIGEGTHERMIVDREKFMQRTGEKA
jgi:fluoroacetyl-CoA thioesterase